MAGSLAVPSSHSLPSDNGTDDDDGRHCQYLQPQAQQKVHQCQMAARRCSAQGALPVRTITATDQLIGRAAADGKQYAILWTIPSELITAAHGLHAHHSLMKVQVLPAGQQVEGSAAFCAKDLRERPPHCCQVLTCGHARVGR